MVTDRYGAAADTDLPLSVPQEWRGGRGVRASC